MRPGREIVTLAGLLGLVAVWAARPAAGQLDPRVNASPPGPIVPTFPAAPVPSYSAPPRMASPLLAGNTIAGGLARGGMSFQGFSPIGDPLSLRVPLGSSALSSFRRDSVSVADALSPPGIGYYAGPYYDPSRTVGTVGSLQGYNPLTVGGDGRPVRTPTGVTLPQVSVPAAGVILSPVQAAVAPVPSLPTSSIFGVEPLPAVPELPKPDLERRLMAAVGVSSAGAAGVPPVAGWSQASNPLEAVMRRELSPQAGLTLPSTEAPPWARLDSPRTAVTPGVVLPPPTPPAEKPPPRITDPSILPGYDVFNDLRLAVALQGDPRATWFEEMKAALRSQPELAAQVREDAARSPQEYLDRLNAMPLTSFTGGGPSPVNNELLKAEALMDIGSYTEAAERYAEAARLDPMNPLPLIGRGHALLAAGFYRSAAEALLRGLDRYPDLARFRMDLTALMGSGEVIDVRRADIARQLSQRESPELRFLLGYLEYHTGDTARGLENLTRAATDPRAPGVMGRYVEVLRARGGALVPGEQR